MPLGDLLRIQPNRESLISLWQQANRLPGGKAIFSKLAAQMAPYTATIGARIEHLEPGHARTSMADRRAVRNHLNCVHALALANLAEETSGLAMLSGLPSGLRGIIYRFEIDYLVKARGTIYGEAHAPEVPEEDGAGDYGVDVALRDEAGTVVCRARFFWRIGYGRAGAGSQRAQAASQR
ncbi:MAG: DUF4442 domain-containing protein [Myxococcales bacterium]|nr:DUF4442 domain-containing protein [Myxococcales bacterium]